MDSTSRSGGDARLFAGTLLSWLIPFGLFGLFMSRAELRPPFSELRFDDPLLAAFVVAWALGVAGWLTVSVQRLERRQARGEVARVRVGVRRLLASLPVLVAVYLVSGSALAVVTLSGETVWRTPDLVLVAALAVVVWIYILLPLGMLSLDVVGTRFGASVGRRRLVPFGLRLSPGLLLPVVVGAVFAIAEYARTGMLSGETALLCATLLPYGLLVSFLNARYSRSAMEGVRGFLARAADGEEVRARELRARAVDEVGVMYNDLATLLRRLEETQQQLTGSEARMRAVASAASDWFFELDADLRVTWVSERYEAVTGRPRDRLLGRAIPEIGRDALVWNPFLEMLAERRPVRGARVRLPLSGGEVRVIDWSAVPQFDPSGAFTGYLGACTDATPVVEAREALHELEGQLAQAQKMEAVGQLTGGIAHDFNNLLMVAAGNLELLGTEHPELEDDELLTTALGAIQRGGLLVQRLLAFSRRQHLAPETFDAERKLEEMAPLLRTTLGERVQLRSELPEAGAPVHLDPTQFESAVLNLAINARDAMPNGGELCIALEAREIADDPELPPGAYVALVLADTGEGMAPEILARVFEPFFSTKPVGAGSGLGLSMVYGFVRQSGGRVEVESEVGVGTRFTLLFPMPEEKGEAALESPVRERASAPGEAWTVLLVEDDDLVRGVVAGALGRLGHRVIPAGDGAAARSVLERESVDLLLADVVLPGALSGVELVESARVRRPSLRCILMTGYEAGHREGLRGASSQVPVLSKPFRFAELRDLLERLQTEGAVSGEPGTR